MQQLNALAIFCRIHVLLAVPSQAHALNVRNCVDPMRPGNSLRDPT